MEKKYTIGIDIGGTKMAGVLFDGKKILADYTLATPTDNLEKFLVMLKALVVPLEDYAKKHKLKISKIGVGVAGTMNKEKTKVFCAPNIPIIENIDLVVCFGRLFNYKIAFDNDVNCFLLAEKFVGAVKNYTNVYAIIIGTGIGGSWFFDGKIYNGFNGGAGEPGEILIDFDNNIKLEQAYHKLTQNNPKILADEAYLGDALAQKTFEELGDYFGKAFANIVNLVDPEVILIGGGAVQASDLFFNRTNKTMRENIVSQESRKNIKIVKSKIGKYAGAIGASLI